VRDGVEEPDRDDPDEIGLTESALVACPYCGASVELLLDPGGGPRQEYVEDCEVCCRPWSVRVSYDGLGGACVDVGTLDEE